jgi:hypothetical protein
MACGDRSAQDRSMELPFAVPAGVELVTDVSPGAWVVDGLMPHARSTEVRVGEVVPTGFEAYARVFHPVHEEPGMTPIRWSVIAERNGRVVHPEMQLEHIAGTLDVSGMQGLEPPLEGNLAAEVVGVLAENLSSHTTTVRTCWFALWDGWGMYGGNVSLSWSNDEDPRAVARRRRAEELRARRAQAQLDAIPTLEIEPDGHGGAFRAYYLFRGSIERASELVFHGWYQSPNLWWPDDRAWCVATEVDGYSTYVGGTTACIDAVLRDERLEALPSDPGNRFDLWSDRVNPRPEGMRERWSD